MDPPGEPEPNSQRGLLLAFIEAHWREMTLRDARSLTSEVIGDTQAEACIKETLTFS
jgi:hypothetical protein